MNSITDIVFDKTGTLTSGSTDKVELIGDELQLVEKNALYALCNSSTHPLSRGIVNYLRYQGIASNDEIDNFQESQGKGISGTINGLEVNLGSPSYCNIVNKDSTETASYFTVGNKKGRFVFSSELRIGIPELMNRLSNYKLHVLSGDKDKDLTLLKSIFPHESVILFEQSPADKLNYITNLSLEGKKVLMVGDGLNDAGALGKADVGIAVSEDVFRFTPSSDAIIEASKLSILDQLLSISNYSKTVLLVCLIFSLTYNIIGLSFAISGNLSPLVAAILMPISSITVVILSTFLIQGKK
jgi:Cu+-exporting ATPase